MRSPFNSTPNSIVVKEYNQEKLLKAIAEKERLGWEVVGEIGLGTKEMAISDPINRGSKYRRDYQSTTVFKVVMRRKKVGGC